MSTMRFVIDLDHNATTPILPEVLEAICASSGSACLADFDEPSHVIKAMRPDTAASRQMIRFSIDANTTQAQIRSVVTAAERETEALRGVVSQA